MNREPCKGAGLPGIGQDPGRFGNAICPVCRGIANTETIVRDDAYVEIIEPHTVLVIDFGEDDAPCEECGKPIVDDDGTAIWCDECAKVSR